MWRFGLYVVWMVLHHPIRWFEASGFDFFLRWRFACNSVRRLLMWSGWFGFDFTLNGVLLRFSGSGSLVYSMVVRGSCEDASARLGFHCWSVA